MITIVKIRFIVDYETSNPTCSVIGRQSYRNYNKNVETVAKNLETIQAKKSIRYQESVNVTKKSIDDDEMVEFYKANKSLKHLEQ